MQRELVEREYRSHHEHWGGSGFVFCGPERIPLFREWVGGPGLRVLDLGCRDGALARTYLPGNRVVGVDVDRVSLDRASRLGVETVWADLDEPLPFEDASFDVVVIAEVLEHVRFPENLLAEARRVLVAGGALVGSVPNCYRLKSRLRFLFGHPPERDPTLLRMFRPADVVGALVAYEHVEIRLLAGRFVRLHPRLFANDIAFRARSPQRVATDPPTQVRAGHPERRAAARAERRRTRVPARLNAFVVAGRSRVVISAVLLCSILFLILAAVPEELGDWPYNVFGH